VTSIPILKNSTGHILAISEIEENPVQSWKVIFLLGISEHIPSAKNQLKIGQHKLNNAV